MTRTTTITITAAAFVACSGLGTSDVAAAVLTGTYTSLDASDSGPSAFINFADEGTADWALWDPGVTNGAPTDEKAGADIIGDAYSVADSGLFSVGGTDLSYSTTPGATSGTTFADALIAGGLDMTGNGVGLTVTAPTLATYHVRIYVGGFKTGENILTANLPGATPIVFTPTYGAGVGGNKDAGVLDLTFQANSLNGTDNVLDVTLTLVDNPGEGNSHVLLQGVTVVPEPASLALLGLGGLLMATRRRAQ